MNPGETSWTLIETARRGDEAARRQFVVEYGPALRAYLRARWTRPPLVEEIEDALQEVWIDCLREGGAIQRVDASRPFRPFLLGIARVVALRFEERARRVHQAPLPDHEPEGRESRLSLVFDRALAQLVMQEARQAMRERAARLGPLHERRVELLELRFQQGLTIAEIARRWDLEPAYLHHMYADARQDFRGALLDVVQRRSGTLGADLERECDWMLEVLRSGRE